MQRTDKFICPKCGEKLTLEGKSYYCENRHCYDVSKYGYVNLLLPNQKNSLLPGDNKEMALARVRVMKKGYYKALSDALIYTLKNIEHSLILDAGCGIGYIADRLKTELADTEVIGTDISKVAIEQACKKFGEAVYAVCSSIRLPLASNSVSGIVCAFAPVYKDEFLRVLKDDGLLLRVVPARNHLYRLKSYLYENPRENEMDSLNIEGFEYLDTILVKDEFLATGEELYSLIQMTPYYYHTKTEDLQKLLDVESMSVNTEFELRIYKKINQ